MVKQQTKTTGRRDNDSNSDDSDVSTTLSDAEERKQARRQNIGRRAHLVEFEQEEIRRKQLEKLIVPNAVTVQIETSEFELAQIIEEAHAVIGEKRLEVDNAESVRKWTDENANRERWDTVKAAVDKINKAYKTVDDQFEAISKKNDVVVIHEDIETIREQGAKLLRQKDEIIGALMREIDDTMSKTLREKSSQSDDLERLYKIANDHMADIKNAHAEHLSLIEQLMYEEMEKKQTNNTTAWQSVYERIVEDHSNAMDVRLKVIEDKEKKLMDQFEENEEKAKNVRINVTKETDESVRELEFVKMKCFENAEKLQYNYDVLRKRTDENATALATRKRRINAMRQTVYDLKTKLRENDKQYLARIPILKEEIVKVNAEIDRLEKKADLIAKLEARKFKEGWALEQTRIIEIIQQIHNTDRIIHEEYLGVPHIALFELPSVNDLPSYKQMVDSIMSSGPPSNDGNKNAHSEYAKARIKALMRLILDLTVKESRLTVDDHLVGIFWPYRMKNLPLIYNMMKTLGLNKTDTWDLIVSNFKPLVYCEVCGTPVAWSEIETKADEETVCFDGLTNHRVDVCKSIDHLMNQLLAFTDDHVNRLNVGLKTSFGEMHEDTKDVHHVSGADNLTATVRDRPDVLCTNLVHKITMDENGYLRVMKKIIEQSKPKAKNVPQSLNQRIDKQYDYFMWTVNEDDMRSFWLKFVKSIPPNRMDFWDTINMALRHYYNALIEQKKQMSKAEKAKTENFDLRSTLHRLELQKNTNGGFKTCTNVDCSTVQVLSLVNLKSE